MRIALGPNFVVGAVYLGCLLEMKYEGRKWKRYLLLAVLALKCDGSGGTLEDVDVISGLASLISEDAGFGFDISSDRNVFSEQLWFLRENC